MAIGSKRLSVGMIGAGWVSRHHLRAWQRQRPDAEVVALADPNPMALGERAREFGIAAIYRSAEELLAEASPDVLDICAPREFHAPLVRLAADRGLPAICQKPLATNLAQARALVAEVGDRIPLMVHENWRFRSYYRRLAEWLGQGAAGDLRHVQLEFLSSGMIPDAAGQRPALVRQPFHGEAPLPKDRLRIFGSQGTIALDGTRLSLAGGQTMVETFDADESYQGAYDRAIAHFVEQLLGDRKFETNPVDNLKTLELVEAIYAANSASGSRTDRLAPL